jgi:O-antigen biosynthesis protein
MTELNPLNHPVCLSPAARLVLPSWQEHIPFAMFLVDVLRPQIIVELGTHYGDSYCAFCQAVKDLSTNTRCFAVDTWQGDPQAGIYGPEVLDDLRSHHDSLYGGFSKLVQSTFDEALRQFEDESIDLLHIDGCHTYEAVKHDFESWLPKVRPGGVVVLHDIAEVQSDFGANRFWAEINPGYSHFEFAHGHGLGVLAKGQPQSPELAELFALGKEETEAVRALFLALGQAQSLACQADTLSHDLDARDTELAARNAELAAKDAELAAKDAELAASNQELRVSRQQLAEQTVQMQQMQRGIVMGLLRRYVRVLERVAPQQTRRRRYYELAMAGTRVLVSEGPGSLLRKTRARLKRKDVVSARAAQDLPQFNASISPGDAGRLAFPAPSGNPVVSIVIPVYNKWRYTANCLKSVLENTTGEYEVIVVDDASSDETARVLSRVQNLRLIGNERNAGFIESCNRGAAESKAEYVLFLNNDTMVTKGWLESMLALALRQDVGAVGSKLVYPDGKLQEAGSIIWNDGSALGYGRGDDPTKPEYEFVREVDYCSGASLLVKRQLFEKIGGLDTRFKPAYYEDADLCFSVRQKGYKVMYQPRSVVVHFEGVTSGTDINSGAKANQELNRPRFAAKWERALESEHRRPTEDNVLFAREATSRKRALVIDDRIPTPSQGSGYPRAYTMLKLLAELDYSVTFFPLASPVAWQPETTEFQQLGVEVFYGDSLDLGAFARSRQDYYDLLLISRPHNMEKATGVIRASFPKAAVVYDAEALFAMRDIMKARLRGGEREQKEASQKVDSEIALMRSADAIMMVSEGEKELVQRKAGRDDVIVWGHALTMRDPSTPFSERKDVLFVGGFPGPDSPNEDAILYFARDVFPLIERDISCRLLIAGGNPPESVRKLSSPSVDVLGFVADLLDLYEKSRIFVVPHRWSAGIPLKLLEAMSHGIPCVVSELSASQLGLVDGNEVLVGHDAADFAEKIKLLCRDQDLWYRIQANALNYVGATCDPVKLKERLAETLKRALEKRSKSMGTTGQGRTVR